MLLRNLTIVDGDINLNSRFNGDTGQLLDNIGRSVKVDQTLVDAHLKAIPSVGTFSGRSLSGGDDQLLGGHTDGSADVKLLVQGNLLQITADLLDVGNIARSQSDTNAVDHGGGGLWVLILLGWVGRHDLI